MPGQFEILTGKTGKCHFVLKAANRQVILTSETYESLAACKNGIASVKNNAGNDAAFERKTAKDGRPFFTLIASNKQVIGASQMYASNVAAFIKLLVSDGSLKLNLNDEILRETLVTHQHKVVNAQLCKPAVGGPVNS